MDNRIIFRGKLTELKTAADERDGILTHDEIHEILKSMPLEEEHFQLIYEYLAGQNIRVVESREEQPKTGEGEGVRLAGAAMGAAENSGQSDGAMSGAGNSGQPEAMEAPGWPGDSAGNAFDAEPSGQTEDEPETGGRQSLSFYLEELEKLAPVDDAEEMRLIDRARAGDGGAKERLIGIYLPLICSMAEEYGEETMSGEDLIQEGNLGLLLAVDSLGEFDSAAACRAWMINMARKAMEDAVKSSQDGQKMDDGLLSRINHLNEAVHNLERDLGHKVSAEEVSAYLEMPLEEIEDLLRVAGDQIDAR